MHINSVALKIFSLVEVFQKYKIWAENPHFGEFIGKIEILSTHNLLCRKFAAVYWKIATSCLQRF